MSLTNFPGGSSASIPPTKVTMPALAEMKRQGKLISALTAYDYATSRLVDEAGIDMILVGDSLAQVILGHDNTLSVTVDEMLHHARAVRRAVRRALVVADMPFGSYHGPIAEGVANAVRFVKEAGAEAVKIEGPRSALVEALTDAEIPVVAHLGLTPQSVHRMGGYRVQARSVDTILRLKSDAHSLADAGAGALVLEGVPREVAAAITPTRPPSFELPSSTTAKTSSAAPFPPTRRAITLPPRSAKLWASILPTTKSTPSSTKTPYPTSKLCLPEQSRVPQVSLLRPGREHRPGKRAYRVN